MECSQCPLILELPTFLPTLNLQVLSLGASSTPPLLCYVYSGMSTRVDIAEIQRPTFNSLPMAPVTAIISPTMRRETGKKSSNLMLPAGRSLAGAKVWLALFSLPY